ncbi:MAG: hypothetical protein L6Q34_06785 [Nitrospira sp.]|nr:MAG: hypothetical protein UZ03_NOB001002647 [Nitrospira sp. OLB3]MCE7965729.1 hypothetical protein [Nitrospira sp. NTP2]MCK6493120.1 hypothetical protein [Nitrospira sp.]QOJ33732.1 MAG: hypothetical protein HRU82_01665 [Nitrospira sp.]RIK58387.1 MAG: hypothetical protein DCC63_10405 [Nitrospira sp.]
MKVVLYSLLALTLISLAACSSSPTASKTRSEMEAGTKTGTVKNIVITETITPTSLTVRAGDEVRWINQRQEPVTVNIDGPLEHNVSCRKGFSKAMGMGIDNSTTLSSNETAGLCFSRIGTVNYSVRPSSDSSASLATTQGSISVQ